MYCYYNQRYCKFAISKLETEKTLLIILHQLLINFENCAVFAKNAYQYFRFNSQTESLYMSCNGWVASEEKVKYLLKVHGSFPSNGTQCGGGL